MGKYITFVSLESQLEKKKLFVQEKKKKSMTKNFLNMVKDICLQIQEAQQIPTRADKGLTYYMLYIMVQLQIAKQKP